MLNLVIFVVQTIMSVLVYAMIAVWYVVPRLAALPLKKALLPLLLANAMRSVGLTFVVGNVTDPNLPPAFAVPAAYNDLITACLALLAILALRRGWGIAYGLVWVMNIYGALDLLSAFVLGPVNNITDYRLGPVWYIPTFLVPALLVIHTLIFIMQVRRRSEYRLVKAEQVALSQ